MPAATARRTRLAPEVEAAETVRAGPRAPHRCWCQCPPQSSARAADRRAGRSSRPAWARRSPRTRSRRGGSPRTPSSSSGTCARSCLPLGSTRARSMSACGERSAWPWRRRLKVPASGARATARCCASTARAQSPRASAAAWTLCHLAIACSSRGYRPSAGTWPATPRFLKSFWWQTARRCKAFWPSTPVAASRISCRASGAGSSGWHPERFWTCLAISSPLPTWRPSTWLRIPCLSHGWTMRARRARASPCATWPSWKRSCARRRRSWSLAARAFLVCWTVPV
mmetsp:Transcript_17579/g.51349  ORF Transcript_17579/g.51349 Transcript_17579/m.51349 type:complete len:284 (+) Transcript_17579:152-1003(+)